MLAFDSILCVKRDTTTGYQSIPADILTVWAGGYLVLGGAETTLNLDDRIERIVT